MHESGALSLAGDIIAAGTALGGLILVYLGSVATGYASYEKTQQGAVRGAFQRRAWFAFVGMILALSSSGIAIAAKWTGSSCVATLAIVALSLTLIWTAVASLLVAYEIK